uniref:Uncharacterized protein n=1 Tax=Fagus sylvatica TaxID=28930 RepID=A0A2N9GS61_FAGSY
MANQILTQQTLSPPKTSLLTPFSAVAPPRVVVVSRLQISTLQTIYEEDNEDECMETCYDQASSSPSFLSAQSSTCFLEVPKPLSGYTHNCQCAN